MERIARGPRAGLALSRQPRFEPSHDLEHTFNVPVTLHAHALYNNGHEVSAELVGDAQGVSNIELRSALRLFEAWAEWRFGSDSHQSLRYGLYDVNLRVRCHAVGEPVHRLVPWNRT